MYRAEKKTPKKCPVSESLKGADIMGLLLLVGKEKERTATHGSSSTAAATSRKGGGLMDNLRLPFVAADEAPGLGADFFFRKKGISFMTA